VIDTGTLHEKFVFARRVRVLSDWFAKLTPRDARILDVGCGDGLISSLVAAKRPDVTVTGVDVLPRERSHIPVMLFDGVRLPYPDKSYDVVLFSDVLHHTEDPLTSLREAARVARRCVLIKDHNRKGIAAGARLRFMDWVGNARYGVSLPYNYWTEAQWRDGWRDARLTRETVITDVGLYPPAVNWVFGAQLHFIAVLTV
jgi:SAM-dependent methyltransferase